MKNTKKILSLILSLCLMLCCSVTAFAAELGTGKEVPSHSITINEYDVYVATREATAEELARNGVSEKHAELVKSNAIENELTKLSKLSFDELRNLGYNNSQIDTIHNYNGERIETNANLRGIFADMTANFYDVAASTSSLSIRVDWEWTNVPVLAGVAIEDMVAIRWQGTNYAGQPLNLALDSSGSSCTTKYYSRGSSPVYQFSRYPSVSTDDPYGHAYAKIPMSTGQGNSAGDYYAKKGSFTIKVDKTGSNSIKEAAFVFGYGHTVIVVSPSLSLPASFGIGFSWGTETMAEEAIRMDNTGNITEY